LAKHLRKELEWIPLKAMHKERVERYRSPSELADDIENYLKGAPLMAGPPSAMYKLRKFVRRNRVLVTGIAAVIAVLIAGVVVSMLFAIKANRQARTAQAISDFFSNDVFETVDPLTGEKPVASLEPILEVVSQSLEGKFVNEPLIEASIRYTLGRRYWHIGKFDIAEVNLKRALDLGRKKLTTNDRQLLLYMMELAWVYFRQGQGGEAEALMVKTTDCMEQVLEETDWALQRAKNRLAWMYMNPDRGRYEEAERLLTEVLDVIRRHLGPDHPDAVAHMEGLAAVYIAQGRLEEAEKVARKALEIALAAYGPEDITTANIMEILGKACKTLGRYDETEELYLKALEIRRRILGEEHFRTRYVRSDLASLYREMERYSDAEPLLVEAERVARRKFGSNHEITNTSVNNLILLYKAWNKPEKAEQWRTKLPQTEAVME
jgi:non-specific serine/threonine protein kinase/serine/threonine-protein kinase